MDKIFNITNEELKDLNLVQYKKKLFQHFNIQQNPHEKSAIALHLECAVLPSTQTLLIYPPRHDGEVISETSQLIGLWRKRLLCFLYLLYVDSLYPILSQIQYHLKHHIVVSYSSSSSNSSTINPPVLIWSGAQHYPPERKICILVELFFLLRLFSLSFSLFSSTELVLTQDISDYISESNTSNQDILWMKNETLHSLFSRAEYNDESKLSQFIILTILSYPNFLSKLHEMITQHESYSLKGMRSHGLYPKLLNDKHFLPSIHTFRHGHTKSLSELMTLQPSHYAFEESLYFNQQQPNIMAGTTTNSSQSPLSRFETKFFRPTPPMLEFNPDFELMWINDVNTYSSSQYIGQMKQKPSEYHLDTGFDIDSTHLFCLYELNSSNKGGFMSSNHQRGQTSTPFSQSSETSQAVGDSGGVVLMKRGKTNQENELNELFSKAFKQQLQPVQTKNLIQNFDKITMFTELLTPNRLTDLVKNNRELASKCLQVLIHTNNKRLNEYMSVLVSIPVSLQLLEVVNTLLNKSDAVTTNLFTQNLEDSKSSSFLHTLLRNCMAHCNQSAQDPPSQTRKVRLVCVFVQRLIREEILTVNPEDFIFLELQSFCIEFVKIKEAAELHSLLLARK
ncbi:hypothetical protein C9374_004960 [Naegleria lovaniensis]|uniref:CCR4-NOT transcription complex subunit 11 n=1 Tax=Naegleria lovaniensis TaxID=51637 RepID=A0AA88GRT6_NAELO|nr:uncharacterized protein C9374_004960 [Naegleria lovaniensis]KAG2382993.1 hypothetical protein C9374_004960 [Naegleria lovaniensis]